MDEDWRAGKRINEFFTSKDRKTNSNLRYFHYTGRRCIKTGIGMAAIVSRKLNIPIINLGFSGNGKLEAPVVSLIKELDAKIYILDGLGNMAGFPTDTIIGRLKKTVKSLREGKPNVPIVITEDPHPSIESLDLRVESIYKRINKIEKSVFAALKSSGMKDIYYLESDSIGLMPKVPSRGCI